MARNPNTLKQAIDALSQVLRESPNPQARATIATLAKPDSAKPMSEAPKYDLRGANIGNFAETVQSGGRQEATQNINTPTQGFPVRRT